MLKYFGMCEDYLHNKLSEMFVKILVKLQRQVSKRVFKELISTEFEIE